MSGANWTFPAHERMTEPTADRPTLIGELRRRGVLRVAASYAAIAWLVIQISDAVADPLELPTWALRALIFAVLAGFPVAVGLAWFLEFTPRGVAVDRAPPGAARPAVVGVRRYADLIIIGLLLIVVGYLVSRQPEVVGLGEKATVAVLPFQNLSTSADGDVLAMGIAEAVLHQLANLQQLDVIARTSSFAFRGKSDDAREIGRQLNAGYLLEGSVQSDRARMRITTQLIDARTGAEVWSMRFDRQPRDLFAVQDEIAVQVTQALELTLDADATERMKGQGTENLEAYLEYLQGRSLSQGDRVTDVMQAIGHFERSVAKDPQFARSYVALARAELFVAEYDVTEDRQARFDRARERARSLIEHALVADPRSGEAYLARASLEAYADLAAAEADYRRGLELSPNSAEGYAGLATVLYETPSRRDESLELLDRARKLDPLQPAYDVQRAVFLLYERSDVRGANDLLADVLRRNPDYLPALTRLCELSGYVMGEAAAGIEYGERAMALEPRAEVTLRAVIRFYLDTGDRQAAERLADASDGDRSARWLQILVYDRDWRRAGEAAYESLARQTLFPLDEQLATLAIRMHARATGDYARARTTLEAMSGIQWDAAGQPSMPKRASGIRDAAIGVADLLLATGEAEKARRLLNLILDRMHQEVDVEGRSEYWYQGSHVIALALAGQSEAALAMLERSVDNRGAMSRLWWQLAVDPALDSLRKDERFKAVLRSVEHNAEQQRRKLDQMRAEGRVPSR
jgi:TolB-like protein/Tfp pilus assembly protein PilF